MFLLIPNSLADIQIGFLTTLYTLLIQAGPYVGLGCFVGAAIKFRTGGGVNFELGGGFVQLIFWGMVFVSIAGLPSLMGDLGFKLVAPSGGTQAFTATTMLNAVETFTQTYLVTYLVPIVGAALVLKALFDSAEGKSPVGSIVSALLVLSANAFWTMANTTWGLTSDKTGITDGLSKTVNWVGSSVCPALAALCIIGCVINYIREKPWGQMAFTALAMVCFSGIWLLVQSWG